MVNTNVPMICKSSVPYPMSTSLKLLSVVNIVVQYDKFYSCTLNFKSFIIRAYAFSSDKYTGKSANVLRLTYVKSMFNTR